MTELKEIENVNLLYRLRYENMEYAFRARIKFQNSSNVISNVEFQRKYFVYSPILDRDTIAHTLITKLTFFFYPIYINIMKRLKYMMTCTTMYF